jgi:hypothetical protein
VIPGISVNNHGAVLVAWIDGGSGTGHRCQETLRVVASTDGGATFTPATVIVQCPVMR